MTAKVVVDVPAFNRGVDEVLKLKPIARAISSAFGKGKGEDRVHTSKSVKEVASRGLVPTRAGGVKR